MTEKRPPPKIIIIGAGISGIAAAKTLYDKGYSVTIIEARDRVGGRMNTDRTTLSAPCDLGASWIHHVDGNPVTELCERFKI